MGTLNREFISFVEEVRVVCCGLGIFSKRQATIFDTILNGVATHNGGCEPLVLRSMQLAGFQDKHNPARLMYS